MDALPVDFYDKISHLSLKQTLRTCGALQGPIGYVALDHIANESSYAISVKNGQIVRAQLYSFHNRQEDGSWTRLESTKQKFIVNSQVSICDDSEAEKDSTTDKSTLPAITGSTSTHLVLRSSTISKASERLLDSIRIVSQLHFRVPIAKRIQEIMEKTVQKRTLRYIFFENDHQFDELSTKLLFSLLKQDQFASACFSSGCRLPLTALITEWREKSHLMIGKRLGFSANLWDQFGPEFDACKEDDHIILRKHYRVNIKDNSTTLVLRGAGERNMYVHVNDDLAYSTLILFA